MSSDRDQLDAEAEALFLGVGLAPQTAKCALLSVSHLLRTKLT